MTEKSSKVKSKDENLEVAPMMDTIKNMVTEMPEPETYERLFEKIEETPTFIPKQKEVSLLGFVTMCFQIYYAAFTVSCPQPFQ